ncbi:hypothetical protein ACFLXC_02105 [Chloroflexota bacterium]
MIFIIPLIIVVYIIAWVLRFQKSTSKYGKYAIFSVTLSALVIAKSLLPSSYCKMQLEPLK